MARTGPIASDVGRPGLMCLDGARPELDGPLLTRADAQALRRSATLTHAKLEEYLRVVRCSG